MKKVLFFIMFVLSSHINAQTILKGDMNDDNEVTIADVTSVVNVVLGKAPLETISAGCSCEPYQVDNSSVVGSWSTPDGTSFQFNEDGTTTFPGGATYEFMPMQGRLLVYDTENQPVKAIPILKVESEKILTVDYATNTFTYYTKVAPAVTYYWYAGQNLTDNYITSSNYQTIATQNEFTTKTINMTAGNYLYVVVPSNKSVEITDPVGFGVAVNYYDPSTGTYRRQQNIVTDDCYLIRTRTEAAVAEAWTITLQ